MTSRKRRDRITVAFLAPWLDYGGTDKGTLDWFRWLDRDRFEPLLITTQPSANRRLHEVLPYAREVWPLPDLVPGNAFPNLIFDLLASRDVDVLHIMNSRLGFELLPDITALPRPPRVVVQLHVEEEDRSGYVRYVTTRYGNLVDAFSVTSRHLAQAVIDYGVAPSRTDVIHTGVDAEGEFAPGIAVPVAAVPPTQLNILMAGRLVPQKDPLLAVEVAASLRERTTDFAMHMVGEGELEAEVRAALREYGLQQHVHLHPSTSDVRPWYEACDVLLLTSTFEGVPYVAFEAMAMGLPVVAASLPGTREVLDANSGRLVDPRGDAAAYAGALFELREPELRHRLGEHARVRMRRDFPIQRMAREHEQVYSALLGRVEEPDDARLRAIRGSRRTPALPLISGETIRLRARPIRGIPSVSVIVPCFNHGRYIGPCVDSVRAQSYPMDRLQTIVVDDASSDPDTRAALNDLESADDVEVIRLEINRGPSAARNAGIERAGGDFVLPLDADNLLLPGAIASLVDQLRNAGEQIGFVYPNLKYFGTRDDYFRAPSYNLALLAQGNYCDTCSLIDRWVFEAGIRYPEEYRVGHEDWDFVLMLAERGVYGIPAQETTLLYRKWGFTRSDVVEYSQEPFHQRLAERHGALLGHSQLGVLKAAWNPALSVIALQEVQREGESRARLVRRLTDQSFEDFEYVGRSNTEFPHPLSPSFRRLPPELSASPADALFGGLETARGRWLMVTSDTGSPAFEDRALVEKLVRVLHADSELDVVALADDGQRDGSFSFGLIDASRTTELAPHAIAASAKLLRSAAEVPGVVPDAPLSSFLLRLLADGRAIQWRHAPTGVPPPQTPRRARGWTTRSWVRPRSPNELVEEEARMVVGPAYPGLPQGWVRRWTFWPGWMPPETLPLCRHRHRGTGEAVVTNDRNPPAGFAIEYDLGSIRRFGSPGTTPLHPSHDSFIVGADGPDTQRPLGHLETAPLPGFEAVRLAVDPVSGAHTLVGEEDILARDAEIIAFMGFVEPYPIVPKHPPGGGGTWGVLGLVRSVDRAARRHRYALGSVPSGDVAGELGATLAAPVPGAVPLWIDDMTATDRYRPVVRRAAPAQAGRWVGAPVTWGHRSDPRGLARAVSRRALSAGGGMLRRRPQEGLPNRPPDAYLASSPGDGRRSLFSAMHPFTGDQLLTPFWLEANDMGYEEITLLGYLLSQSPVTGSLELARPVVPWASRFGLEARWG